MDASYLTAFFPPPSSSTGHLHRVFVRSQFNNFSFSLFQDKRPFILFLNVEESTPNICCFLPLPNMIFQFIDRRNPRRLLRSFCSFFYQLSFCLSSLIADYDLVLLVQYSKSLRLRSRFANDIHRHVQSFLVFH